MAGAAADPSQVDVQEKGQEDGKRSEVLSAAAGLGSRALSTVLNALSFTMGLGWLAFTKVVVSEDCCNKPTQDQAGQTWLCFLVAALILVPVSALLIWRKLHLARRSEDAAAKKDLASARRLNARAAALQAVVSWGAGFTLAGQLANAASATLSSSSWEWRAVYAGSLLVFVVVFAYIVLGIGSTLSLNPEVLDSVADTIVSGAAYTIALAFLDAASTAFSVNDVNESTNLAFLAAFSAVTLVVTTAAVAVLACCDRADATQATKEVKQNNETTKGSADNAQPLAPGRFVKGNIRKLLAKTLSMCGVVAVYALIYAAITSSDALDGSGGDMTEPLMPRAAVVFFVASFVVAVLGSIIVECTVQGGGERLKKLDPLPGQDYDDYVVAALLTLTQTSASTVLEALSWLVGIALHEFAMVGYAEAFNKGDAIGQGASKFTKVLISLGYAILVTAITVTVMVVCAPPPMQAGSTKPLKRAETAKETE